MEESTTQSEVDPAQTLAPTRPKRSSSRDLIVIGAALITVISAGLGWAVTSRAIDPPLAAVNGAAPSRSFRYWSATAVPPPMERFSAVRPPSPIGDLASWPHEALASLPDPNVLEPGFAPLLLDEFEAGLVPDHLIRNGPRLAIGGLDALRTRDLGRVLVTRSLQTELVLVNVGDGDLVVARVYAGTRAITAKIGKTMLDASGYPARPIVIPVGTRQTMILTLEGRRLLENGTQAEHLQIFTNDGQHELFDPSDAFSHETRVRLVLDGRELERMRRPIAISEIPLAGGAPRLSIPDLEVDGRGGDVIRLGNDLPVGPSEIELQLSNRGDVPLEIDSIEGPGIEPALEVRFLEPGSSARLLITVSPDEDLDKGRWIQRVLKIKTNDPLVPEVELSIIGSWEITGTDPDS